MDDETDTCSDAVLAALRYYARPFHSLRAPRSSVVRELVDRGMLRPGPLSPFSVPPEYNVTRLGRLCLAFASAADRVRRR